MTMKILLAKVTITGIAALGLVFIPGHKTTNEQCISYDGLCTSVVYYTGPHTYWLCQLSQAPYNSANYHVGPGYTCKKGYEKALTPKPLFG